MDDGKRSGQVVRFLVDNPLLLLFVVVAIGYPLGRLRVRGSSLGVASVLFAGLAVGAFDRDLRLPDILYPRLAT
jgi:putative transport protein